MGRPSPAAGADLRGAARAILERLQKVFEVISTDVLEWTGEHTVMEPRKGADYTVDQVRAPIAPEWHDVIPPGRRRAMRTFLARDDRGYLVCVGGRLVGWVWLSRTSHRDPWSGLRIRLASDEAYTYALWVDPAYRPLGVAANLMATVLSDAQANPSIARVYGWVDRNNRESQMMLRVLFGFREVQRVRRVHILRRLGWKLPGSDRPAFGPLSRRGRHSEAPVGRELESAG